MNSQKIETLTDMYEAAATMLGEPLARFVKNPEHKALRMKIRRVRSYVNRAGGELASRQILALLIESHDTINQTIEDIMHISKNQEIQLLRRQLAAAFETLPDETAEKIKRMDPRLRDQGEPVLPFDPRELNLKQLESELDNYIKRPDASPDVIHALIHVEANEDEGGKNREGAEELFGEALEYIDPSHPEDIEDDEEPEDDEPETDDDEENNAPA